MAHVNDDEAFAILEPVVDAMLAQSTAPRFSTKRLIEVLRTTEEGQQAYEAALASIMEEAGTDHMARMVIHGQVVPGILRRSRRVKFAGFVHGNPAEDDGYAVPSWWRRV